MEEYAYMKNVRTYKNRWVEEVPRHRLAPTIQYNVGPGTKVEMVIPNGDNFVVVFVETVTEGVPL